MTQAYLNDEPLLTDEEVELLSNYVDGSMNADDETAFEDRMLDDKAFFVKVAPLITLWLSPPPSVIEAAGRVMAAQPKRAAAFRRRVSGISRLPRATARYLALAAGIAAIVVSGLMQRAASMTPAGTPLFVHVPHPTTAPLMEKPSTIVVAKATRSASKPSPVIVGMTDAERVSLAAAEQPLPGLALTPSSRAVATADNSTPFGGRPYYRQPPDIVHKGYTNTFIPADSTNDGGLRGLIKRIFGRIPKPRIHKPGAGIGGRGGLSAQSVADNWQEV
jgi:anti-sigma factor RsiW